MDISLVRIDNRLIHGQILEAWVPFIKASCIVVADDDVANDFFRESVVKMAVPSQIEVVVNGIQEFSKNHSYNEKEGKKTIVLFCNVCDALRAYRFGFRFEKLNVGNVHSEDGRKCCTPTVYLSEMDIEDLRFLVDLQVKVELRSLPRDKPVDFSDMIKKSHLHNSFYM